MKTLFFDNKSLLVAVLTVSVSPETPPSSTVAKGTEITATTIRGKGLSTDSDLEEVSFYDRDLLLGSGSLENGELKLNFETVPIIMDQSKDFDIRVKVAENAPAGMFKKRIFLRFFNFMLK